LGAAASPLLELREQLDAGGLVLDHHRLQARAEQAGDRLRELLGRFEAIGDHAADARVVAREQSAGAGADALHAAMQILERALAVAAQRGFVLDRVEGALALELPRAQRLELTLERLALVFREALAVGDLDQTLLERGPAGDGARELSGDALALLPEAI